MRPTSSYTFRVLKHTFGDALALLARRRAQAGFFFLVAAGLIWVLHRWDYSLMKALAFEVFSQERGYAALVSETGSLGSFPLMCSVILWLLGQLLKSPRIKATAVVCLLAGVVAGITVVGIRSAVGRPRPSTPVADGFYGPTVDFDYLGFPSGHTGAIFGYGTAMAVMAPPAAVPIIAFAGAVGWSRMAMNRHRPTDVAAGMAIGLFWGSCLGLAGRRALRNTLPKSAS